MSWDSMSHEDAKLKNFLTDEKHKTIGFTLSGMTYDGDGNCQWEKGTDMQILMKNKEEFLRFIDELNTIKSLL